MNDKFHNTKCFLSHMGLWLMDALRFNQLSSLMLSKNIEIGQVEDAKQYSEIMPEIGADAHDIEDDDDDEEEGAVLTQKGILIVPISGTIMKQKSSFGGTSSIQIRRIMRAASHNDKVKAIMLNVDSPGGFVAGTDEMAKEIAATAAIKPVHAHANGLMASAAFWTASQASVITASRTSEVGSLGTVAVVHDFSGNFEKEGIKTHIISTGKFKGAGEPGSEITAEHLADIQETVDDLNDFFKDAVKQARGFDQKKVDKLFDGRTHLADKALELGLIDGVMSFEEALTNLEAEIPVDAKEEEAAMARVRIGQSTHI